MAVERLVRHIIGGGHFAVLLDNFRRIGHSRVGPRAASGRLLAGPLILREVRHWKVFSAAVVVTMIHNVAETKKAKMEFKIIIIM